jgi:hypothetical protein
LFLAACCGIKNDCSEILAAIKQLRGTNMKIHEYNQMMAYLTRPGLANKKVAKIPVIPPKPDLVNGHSDWNTEDWLESIDPGGWANEDKRRSGILEFELADEYWRDQYQQYLDGGGTLGFDAWYQSQINKKISREINKRVKDKQKNEGLAAILGLSPNKI